MILNKNNYKSIVQSIYKTDKVDTSIVHLGLGAFFKAHLASYIDEYNSFQDDIWAIEAVSLMTDTSKKLMKRQDNLYTLHLKGFKNSSFKIISSVKNTLFLGEDREHILNLMTSEMVKIISLTITEKGYCYSQSTSGLDSRNPNIQYDLKNLNKSKSAIGLICYAMKRRKEFGFAGITIMSCDNLPSNGKILKKVVLDFAELIDIELKEWIESRCTFPSTMVDRIVPKMTDKSLTQINHEIGMDDFAGIICEDFAQFVIEDKFVGNKRPELSKVGVLFVKEIKYYENMKLRVLNGTHSALAYIGQLLKKETIFEAISDKKLEVFIVNMLKNEIIPSLERVDGVDFEEYAKSIINRYKNPNIIHKTIQISMDGSQKLPQRWLETLKYLINNGKNYDSLAICIASWIKFTSSKNLQNIDIEVNDPLADEFRKIWVQNSTNEDVVRAYFSIENIFESFFLNDEKLIKKVANYLENIENLEDLIQEVTYEDDI